MGQSHKDASRSNRRLQTHKSNFQTPTKTGAWLLEEDDRLRDAVFRLGMKWVAVARLVGTRNGDQCAKRWTENLNPDLDHSPWTSEEENKLLRAVQVHGRNWKYIAEHIMGARAPLALKNRYSLLLRHRKNWIPLESSAIVDSNADEALFMPYSWNLTDLAKAEESLRNTAFPDTDHGAVSGIVQPVCHPLEPNAMSAVSNHAAMSTGNSASGLSDIDPDAFWHSDNFDFVTDGEEDRLPPSAAVNLFDSRPGSFPIASDSMLRPNKSDSWLQNLGKPSAQLREAPAEYTVTCSVGRLKATISHLIDAALSESQNKRSEDDQVTARLFLSL